jgi:hypothetical protein
MSNPHTFFLLAVTSLAELYISRSWIIITTEIFFSFFFSLTYTGPSFSTPGASDVAGLLGTCRSSLDLRRIVVAMRGFRWALHFSVESCRFILV